MAGPGQEEALASVMRRLSLLWDRLRGKSKEQTPPAAEAPKTEQNDES